MKIGLKLVALGMCMVVMSCASMSVKRGADKECNCFFSTSEPAVRITFADNFYLKKDEKNKARYMDYLWNDKDGILWIYVEYTKNTVQENIVDYYYPIDKVLYQRYGTRNMNVGYGSTSVHGYKVYYCDYIKYLNDNKIAIIRDMVLSSGGHDWIQFRMGHTFSHMNFKDKYHSANAFFADRPSIKKTFYDAVDKAIASIESCDISEFADYGDRGKRYLQISVPRQPLAP